MRPFWLLALLLAACAPSKPTGLTYAATWTSRNTMLLADSGWVAELSSDREILWTATFSTGAYETFSIQETGDGKYAWLSATEDGEPILTLLASDGSFVWTQRYDIEGARSYEPRVFPIGDGEFFLVSGTSGNAAEPPYVAKLDSSGIPIWSAWITHESDPVIARNAVALADGNLAVIGKTQERLWIGVVTNEGSLTKQFWVTGESLPLPTAAHELDDGSIVVAGHNQDAPQNGPAWVFKLDTELGALDWSLDSSNKGFTHMSHRQDRLVLVGQTDLQRQASGAFLRADILVTEIDTSMPAIVFERVVRHENKQTALHVRNDESSIDVLVGVNQAAAWRIVGEAVDSACATLETLPAAEATAGLTMVDTDTEPVPEQALVPFELIASKPAVRMRRDLIPPEFLCEH